MLTTRPPAQPITEQVRHQPSHRGKFSSSLSVLLLVLLLSACGSSAGTATPASPAAPPATTAADPTPAVGNALPTDTSAEAGGEAFDPGIALPAMTPVSLASLAAGQFSISTSGSIMTGINGTGEARLSASAPAWGYTVLLYAPASGATPQRGITLVMPVDIQTGTHPVQSYYNASDSSGRITGVGAMYTETSAPDQPVMNIQYDAYDGELTLESLDPLTGSLTLDASAESLVIRVAASFNALPVTTEN